MSIFSHYIHDTGIIQNHKNASENAGCWTIEETRVLISVWSDESIQTLLDLVARNKSVYEAVARQMMGAGLRENVAQCKTTIKNMIHRY